MRKGRFVDSIRIGAAHHFEETHSHSSSLFLFHDTVFITHSYLVYAVRSSHNAPPKHDSSFFRSFLLSFFFSFHSLFHSIFRFLFLHINLSFYLSFFRFPLVSWKRGGEKEGRKEHEERGRYGGDTDRGRNQGREWRREREGKTESRNKEMKMNRYKKKEKTKEIREERSKDKIKKIKQGKKG